MKLRRICSRHLGIGTSLLLLSLQSSFSEAPETIAQALSRHHIVLTPPTLVDALRNSDKEVRRLAAAELAELRATGSLPEIMYAAETEQDAQTKVSIAASATWLGSVPGLNMIKGMCMDTTLPPLIREDAARHVFDQGDHACFRAVANFMLPSEGADTRIGAIYLLSQHARTDEELRLVYSRLLEALADQNVRIRLATCNGLRLLNNPEAIPSLRISLANEHEEVVRNRMQAAINSLATPKP